MKQAITTIFTFFLGVRRGVAGLSAASPRSCLAPGFSLLSLTHAPHVYSNLKKYFFIPRSSVFCLLSSLLTFRFSLFAFRSWLLCLTFLFTLHISHAQNFTYKAKVDAVSTTGFYKIQLTPAFLARAGASLNDLRIFDNDGKETPYLLKEDATSQSENKFHAYEILSTQNEGNWQGIVVRNETKNLIDKLIFEMKNAEAERSVRISGSNDNVKWFVVRDSFNFAAYGDESISTQYKIITFPSVDYEYYKIEIKNKGNSPLNMLKVGYDNVSYQTPAYQLIDGISYTRKDSDKKTYLYITCTPANKIHKLQFNVNSPELFHRQALISQQAQDAVEGSPYNKRDRHGIEKYNYEFYSPVCK